MDREGMHGAVSPVERDILAGYKRMRSEKEAGFIIVLVRHIIVKNPATMFGTPRLMYEQTHLVALTSHKPAYSAVAAMCLPCGQIDMATTIEGRNQVVPVLHRAIRKVL